MVTLGASVLLGWTFDIAVFKGVVPGLVTMKANTALGMMLGGSALALLSWKNAGTPLLFWAAVLAGIMIALGASTLGEYFFGWNLGIDQLLFREPTPGSETLQPGRMSPSSAFCFIMAGSALGVASQRMALRARFPIMWALGATLIVIGGIGSLGQIANALLQVHLWNYFGMAVHTSIGFVLLGSGLLALVKSERGMTWALDKMTTAGFIISIVIFLTAAGVSWNYTNELESAAAWVSHTHEVLKKIGDVRAGVAELESSQRGYIILGDEALLTPRAQVSTEIRQSIENLRSLTADNPRQKPNLELLEPLVAQRTDFDDQTISVRREQGFPAAEHMIAQGPGSALSARIERVLAAMRGEEESLLVTRKKAASNVCTATFLLLPVVVFLSLTTLSLALFFLNTGITERGLAQEVSTRLAAIVDSSNDAIIGKDSDSIVTSWNRGAEKLFGYSSQEMIGRTITLLIPLDRQQEELHIIQKVKNGETVESFDTVRATKDGRLIDIAVSVSPIKDKTGRIVGASKVARDITERKLTEKALHGERDFISAVVDTVGSLVVVIDRQARIIRFNRACEQLTGYSFAEVQGRNLIDLLIMPEERATTTHEFENLCAGQFPNTYENHWLNKQGNARVIEWSNTALVDSGGVVEFVIGTGTDITVRKRGEETLRRQAAIIDLSPDAIIVRDLDEKIISWSRGAEALYGWAEEEVLGQVTHSLFKTRFSEPLEKITEQFEKTGRWSGELIHRTKEGRSVHVQSWWLAEIDELGKRTGLLESNIDITERKQVEQEVQDLNARLEERVAERTSELEAANKELEAFSYSVSHDLRAPLRAVDGFSQAVLEDYGAHLPEEGRRDLQTIRNGAQRMGILIDDLLRFSRLSRAPLNSQEVNIAKLVGKVLEELKPQQEGRQIEIRRGELAPCRGDLALLDQVWTNLLSNAFKYSRKCELAIIEIGCFLQDGEQVYFVRDNGAGFDMRYVQKLFGVFQRLHRVDEFEGTGVGLAIVQRIIHRHGGRIWAEAAVKRGAAFYFTLQEKTNQ